MHPALNIAIKASRKAGDIINRSSERLDLLTIRHKSLNDLVSEVDKAAEDAIIDILRGSFPDHAILAEESGKSGNSEFVWIIDPLDGTTNFLHGLPIYCVSIALMQKNTLQVGVIYDPTRNDLYTASRGEGAFLNDRRIRVSKRDKLIDGLIGTGFPFKMFEHDTAYLAMLKDIMKNSAGVRRPGAAALDLASVAAGRLDGFWEIGLSPWDMAAGALLIQEAGGLVGDLLGDNGFLQSGQILAGNPKIFAQIITIINPHISPQLRAISKELIQ